MAGRRSRPTRTSRGKLGAPLLGRIDRDDASAPPDGEAHRARGTRVERVVPAHADAVAGLEAAAPLAHDDLSTADPLAGEGLHTEALGVGVAAVAAGAEALLMRHQRPPSQRGPRPSRLPGPPPPLPDRLPGARG